MSELGIIEDTLFVPMQGRIYASLYCPQILYDKKALELKERISFELEKQSQYTFLASAVRSANMDRIITDFLNSSPDGVIVQLGCGLETTYHRLDNGRTRWYAVDLPSVIEYRRILLAEPDRESYISEDAFAGGWIRLVREEFPFSPILVIAAGLFHYFEKDKVLDLLRSLGQYGEIIVVFDAVNKMGLSIMRRKYMKKLGHPDARMHFYVDSAEVLVNEIGHDAKLVSEQAYYHFTPRRGLSLSTRISMRVSDSLKMLKIIQIKV